MGWPACRHEHLAGPPRDTLAVLTLQPGTGAGWRVRRSGGHSVCIGSASKPTIARNRACKVLQSIHERPHRERAPGATRPGSVRRPHRPAVRRVLHILHRGHRTRRMRRRRSTSAIGARRSRLPGDRSRRCGPPPGWSGRMVVEYATVAEWPGVRWRQPRGRRCAVRAHRLGRPGTSPARLAHRPKPGGGQGGSRTGSRGPAPGPGDEGPGLGPDDAAAGLAGAGVGSDLRREVLGFQARQRASRTAWASSDDAVKGLGRSSVPDSSTPPADDGVECSRRRRARGSRDGCAAAPPRPLGRRGRA